MRSVTCIAGFVFLLITTTIALPLQAGLESAVALRSSLDADTAYCKPAKDEVESGGQSKRQC
ncbi:hypothetical protein ANO14919_089050 [Xylariales sp. No.14919]|nr:hypothetical protein ANO14919_089050 [Xylariales sp. No.14919]